MNFETALLGALKFRIVVFQRCGYFIMMFCFSLSLLTLVIFKSILSDFDIVSKHIFKIKM